MRKIRQILFDFLSVVGRGVGPRPQRVFYGRKRFVCISPVVQGYQMGVFFNKGARKHFKKSAEKWQKNRSI